jgi:beta-glucanase (GH16 family)
MLKFLERFLVFRELRAVEKILAAMLVIVQMFGALLFEVPQVPSGQKIDLAAWELVWADEFDGDALDTTKWRPAGDGMRRGGYWDANNAIVQDGVLLLRTDYQEDGRFGPGWYSGAIETRDLYDKKYGYFECRAICPGAAGLWGAFWTFSHGVGNIDGTGHDGTEIDIFESPLFAHPQKYKRNSVTHTIHFDGYGEDHQACSSGISVFRIVYRIQYIRAGVERKRMQILHQRGRNRPCRRKICLPSERVVAADRRGRRIECRTGNERSRRG